MIGLGKRSTRSCLFAINLEKVPMDDVMRHERVIADLCRRIEYFDQWFVPPLDQIPSLPNVKFCVPNNPLQTFTLSNSNKTCTAIQHSLNGCDGELSLTKRLQQQQTMKYSKCHSYVSQDRSPLFVWASKSARQTTVRLFNQPAITMRGISIHKMFLTMRAQLFKNHACTRWHGAKKSVLSWISRRKSWHLWSMMIVTLGYSNCRKAPMNELRAFITVQGNGDTVTIVDR